MLASAPDGCVNDVYGLCSSFGSGGSVVCDNRSVTFVVENGEAVLVHLDVIFRLTFLSSRTFVEADVVLGEIALYVAWAALTQIGAVLRHLLVIYGICEIPVIFSLAHPG